MLFHFSTNPACAYHLSLMFLYGSFQNLKFCRQSILLVLPLNATRTYLSSSILYSVSVRLLRIQGPLTAKSYSFIFTTPHLLSLDLFTALFFISLFSVMLVTV